MSTTKKNSTHLAAFTPDKKSASIGKELLKVTYDWKGAFCQVGKKIITPRFAHNTIDCYLDSLGKDDDFCIEVQECEGQTSGLPLLKAIEFIDEVVGLTKNDIKTVLKEYDRRFPESKQRGRFVQVPCKKIYHLDSYPAATPQESMELALVDSECDFCPRFPARPKAEAIEALDKEKAPRLWD